MNDFTVPISERVHELARFRRVRFAAGPERETPSSRAMAATGLPETTPSAIWRRARCRQRRRRWGGRAGGAPALGECALRWFERLACPVVAITRDEKRSPKIGRSAAGAAH
jgi:hypothetical protein